MNPFSSQPYAELRLLTVDDLAAILRRSKATILSDLTRAPHRVPPRCRLPGHSRNLWRIQDVEVWTAAHIDAAPANPAAPPPIAAAVKPRPKRGRPTKVEALARQHPGRLA